MSNKIDKDAEDTLRSTERAIKSSESSDSLGVTYQYTGNRNLWDSEKSKQEYRDSVFGDKQTIVDENGNILHKSHQAAKNKYHQKNAEGENVSTAWAKHAAETDHKISLESLHSHAKHNPFLSDADLREIANSPENYQILSKSDNASKGAENSATMREHVTIHGKFAQRTAQNVTGEFTSGAVESVKNSAMNIIMDSLNKLLIEDESLEDTLKDAGEAVLNTAIIGGTEKLLIDTATHIFANSGNQVLSSIVEMNGVGQCLVLGAAIGSSAIKYLNGEITTEQFSNEILVNGIAVGISTAVSIAIPVPFLAPVISGIAIKAINLICQTKQQADSYLLKEEAIKKLEHEAIAEMKYQRSKFHEIVQEDFNNWDSTVEDAFNQMISSSVEGTFNLDGIVSGLDKVLSLCGEKVKFHSVDEWESQLDMPLELSF